MSSHLLTHHLSIRAAHGICIAHEAHSVLKHGLIVLSDGCTPQNVPDESYAPLVIPGPHLQQRKSIVGPCSHVSRSKESREPLVVQCHMACDWCEDVQQGALNRQCEYVPPLHVPDVAQVQQAQRGTLNYK